MNKMTQDDFNDIIKKAKLDREKFIDSFRYINEVDSMGTVSAIIYLETNIDVLKYKFKDKNFMRLNNEIHYILDNKYTYDHKVINKWLAKHKIYKENTIILIEFIVCVITLFWLNYKYITDGPFSYIDHSLTHNILLTILILLCGVIATGLLHIFLMSIPIKLYKTPKLDDLL